MLGSIACVFCDQLRVCFGINDSVRMRLPVFRNLTVTKLSLPAIRQIVQARKDCHLQITIFQKMFLVAREILVTNGSYSIRVRLPVFGNSIKLPSPEMRNESVLIIPSAIKLCRS